VIVRPEHMIELIWTGWLMSWLTASFWELCARLGDEID